jgi:putative copper resistance protein D
VEEKLVPLEQRERLHDMQDATGLANEPHHDMANMTSEEHANGHHHHRPAILPPEEDKAYSEWNHHVAGVFVLLAGGLALLASVGGQKYGWARYGWPGLFFMLGLFLLVRHDPESWPWGPLTFWESVTDAQVLQHMLFTLIVLGIGAIEWLRYRGVLSHPAWSWLFPSLAVSAAIMLFMHKHGEGAVADKIYRHHSIMAVSGIMAMVAKVFDESRSFNSRIPGYVWTILIMFVGFMLLIYTE